MPSSSPPHSSLVPSTRPLLLFLVFSHFLLLFCHHFHCPVSPSLIRVSFGLQVKISATLITLGFYTLWRWWYIVIMVLDGRNVDCCVDEDNDAPKDVVDDGSRAQKNKCGKVPKRVLKSEREKLKREQFKDLFTKLGSLIELSDPNNGKAAILNETIRLLKDTIPQIQSLRMENAALLSETNYVTVEKTELKDENSALEVQIKRLQVELEEKLVHSKPDLNATPPESWQAEAGSHFPVNHLPRLPFMNPSAEQPPMMGPLYVIPINTDFQATQKADTVTTPPVPVSKPLPRYPTPADSWPLHLLSKQTQTTAESTVSSI